MKVMVIGGTGHVGRFMVPMLVEAGCEVVVVGSGRTMMCQDGPWAKVKYITCVTGEGKNIDPLLAQKPEVVIEMPGHAWWTYQQMKVCVQHFIACGSLWFFGLPKVVPTPEQTQAPCIFEDYARRYDQMLQMLEQSKSDGVAFTGIMPPNISGPGKIPLECMAGRELQVHKSHAAGQEVILPDGPDVLIGPCDAEDVAGGFVQALLNRDKAAGELFNVGSAYALTNTQFVEAYSQIYNVTIPIKRIDWRQYIEKINPLHWWGYKSHMCPDISKAARLLNYKPKHTPQQSLARAVDWMRQQKII